MGNVASMGELRIHGNISIGKLKENRTLGRM
jgi:hypothetical protein